MALLLLEMENSGISHLIDGTGMFRKGASEEIEKLHLFEALQRNAELNPELVDGWIDAMEKRYESSLPKKKLEEKISVPVPISITVANPDARYVVEKSKAVDYANNHKVDQKELVAAYK